MTITPTRQQPPPPASRFGHPLRIVLLLLWLLAPAATPLLPADARAVGIGDPAPDFTAENVLDSAPDVFQLSQYRGQIVVLSFFAYW